MAEDQDQWARWVLRQRDFNDALRQNGAVAPLDAFRDGVLERAAVAAGDVLLDVGCGAGLIGFAALDLVGAGGQVVFSDVSADLLDACRRRAAEDGVLDRCRFIQASAEDLRSIDDASVDVVTTRSVLIYVRDKATAFAEFFRVLRPGGRLSIFEPINGFWSEHETSNGMLGLDMTPVADLAAKVRDVYLSVPADQDPMRDFDERDLLRYARAAGFTAVTMDFRAEIDAPRPPLANDWDTLKTTAPNPLALTYEQALAQALTAEERERFEGHVRTALAAGTPGRTTMATTFLRAVRP